MDENFTAKIGDVGIVGTFKETERSIIYLAPEVLEDRMNCTKAADVYSFGIVMWEMWHGKQAFTELMPFDKVTFQKKIVAGYRPEQDKSKTSCPGPHTLMKSCWATDPHKRPSVNHCYKNLWGTCVQMKGYKLYESPV
jgi:serine/threonine protein kinase